MISRPQRRASVTTTSGSSKSLGVMSLIVVRLALCLVVLLPTFHNCFSASATEVQATQEWTLLGDNDTIAAGMHVRMDLEKGERWVKLLDDDDSKARGTANVAADGSQVMVVTGKSSDNDKNAPSFDKMSSDSATTTTTNMDFDMMHRTLSHLPDEERQRLQLPDYVATTNVQDRPDFERKMITIWRDRQEQLRLLDQQQADLPQLLKERVQQLQAYFDDADAAATRLQRVNVDRDYQVGFIDAQDIVSVLYDLEYHLTDIDMTRDFYTLGGWPLLVSLLDLELHLQNATTLDADLLLKADRIQLYAAWCIGSAVKNQPEFHSFATERILTIHSKQSTSALDLLLQQIASYNDLDYDFSETLKLNKFLYALGALLRGNRDAQTYFLAIHGPAQLGTLLARAVKVGSRASHRIATRLLTLVDDVISDIYLHPSASQQVDDAVVKAFAVEDWCDAALEALSTPDMRSEAILKGFRTLMPHCESWKQADMRSVVQSLLATWEGEASETDPDVQDERISLAKMIMDEIQAVKR